MRPPGTATARPHLDSVLLMAAVTVCWGLNWPAMKLAVNEIPVWSFRLFCLAAGGAGLLGISRITGQSLGIPRGRRGPLVFTAFLNITLWHVLSAYGLTLAQAGRSAIIGYTMPIWASVLGVLFLRERLGGRKILGMAIGMSALALLMLPGLSALASAPLGGVLMLGAAMAWGAGTVASKYWDWGMPTTTMVGWQMVIGGLPVALGWLLFDPGFDLGAVSTPGWVGAVYSALVPMIFCHWAYYKTVLMFPANVAALATLATPVVGVVSSILLLGEPLGPTEILSMALVTLALTVILSPSRPVPHEPARNS